MIIVIGSLHGFAKNFERQAKRQELNTDERKKYINKKNGLDPLPSDEEKSDKRGLNCVAFLFLVPKTY